MNSKVTLILEVLSQAGEMKLTFIVHLLHMFQRNRHHNPLRHPREVEKVC